MNSFAADVYILKYHTDVLDNALTTFLVAHYLYFIYSFCE
jgi:hypothetical protein